MFPSCRQKKNSPDGCCQSFAPDVLRSVEMSVCQKKNKNLVIFSPSVRGGSQSPAEVWPRSPDGVRSVYHNHTLLQSSWANTNRWPRHLNAPRRPQALGVNAAVSAAGGPGYRTFSLCRAKHLLIWSTSLLKKKIAELNKNGRWVSASSHCGRIKL